jgi:DNA-binding CsgD family transcriptional regulator
MNKETLKIYTNANEVCDVCNALCKNSIIKYFNYAKYYEKGSGFCLTTHPDWHTYFIKKVDYVKTVQQVFIEISNGMFLWEDKIAPVAIDACKNFKIYKPIAIVKYKNPYYEICSFGIDADCSESASIDFYLNNLDILKRFILYFKDKMIKLIKRSDNNCNQFAIPMFPQLQQSKDKITTCSENRLHKQQLLSDLKIERYLLENKHGIQNLSRRELECLLYVLKGRTSRETGNILCISPKTVDTNLSIVRDKLDCSSRAELFSKAMEIGIFDLLL